MDAVSQFMRYFTGRTSNSNANRANPDEYATSWGPFHPTYYAFPIRKPLGDAEAQKLYNHIRTVAWWLDALPFLTHAGLPFKVGVDDIISAFPIWGDFAGALLSVYQVFLSWMFGVPQSILIRMVRVYFGGYAVRIQATGKNIDDKRRRGHVSRSSPYIITVDALDVLFKANLRNLDLLEDWLLKDAPYKIALMPKKEFLPRKSAAGVPNNDGRDKYRNRTKTTRMDDNFAPPDLD
ncbi:hypothetical protein FRC09_018353 [Ceratobasidium sp. 395]|nr:hypothetical protein FRC09_018353 [Ceratobasidium sp. 395]